MNILIVCTRALGDVLRTSFLAQALKEKYGSQKTKIFWITDKVAKPLFINSPHVDSVLGLDEIDKIKKIKFDLIINLEVEKEVCSKLRAIPHKKVIGAFLNKEGNVDYTSEGNSWFDMSLISRYGLKKADQLKKKNKKTHKELISEIGGVNPKKYEPFLRLTAKQKEIASNFLRRHGLKKGELIIGLNTGGADSWPKALPVKKTALLIDELYKKYHAPIIIFGGPNELERNREIQKLTKSPVIDSGSGNNLFEFPALVSICSLVITTDSLGLHISLALKKKTICLIGPTSPTEIDLYGLGEKVVADSKEVCTYRKATLKCMEKINLNKILNLSNKLLKQDITILITAFKEPKISKAIECALNQKTNEDYNVIVSAPDEETLNIAESYRKNHKNLNIFKDPGKGKSYALNLIFGKIDTDLLILTDGDVFLGESALEEIRELFFNPEMGCATGRPVPVETKKTKYGYWANFLFDAAHQWRKKAFEKDSFLECSGYLFAFRKDKIDKIPLDVAEDTVIPYFFWEKGYQVGYAEGAKVYVKNVSNWNDWIKQKTRTAKAHETLSKYVDVKTTPRVKTFSNEIKGIKSILNYPSNLKELLWTFQLVIARMYMWLLVNLDTKFKNKSYRDAWERIESTK